MKSYGQLLKIVRKITGGLVIVMLAVLVVVVLAAVFYRYVLSDSITWSAEVARYVCVWIGFLAASLIMNDRGHIGLEFFVNKLPRSLNRFAILLSDVAILVFLIIVIYQGIMLAVFQMDQFSPTLQVPMTWPYASVPVSACLMALEILYLIFTDISDLRRSDSEVV
jgi:TRAP-type transport system small permease protein